jgi:processive 1,2-diacylglycerol beta-glucosyltransferase
MEISDLLITKPGGMTCTEGMAKGIPMLFYTPLPGQEEENSFYFTQQGYAEEISSFGTISNWFNLLRDQYPTVLARREKMIQTINRYHPEDCSLAIMQLLERMPIIYQTMKK